MWNNRIVLCYLKDMNGYLIETHVHSSEASRCAVHSGSEQARCYKNLGYTAVIMTDHFINGNTVMSGHKPWASQVDLFFLGYEAARAEGKRLGLDVWFGLESNFSGTEFILTGIDKDWIKRHPEMAWWSIEDQFKAVDAAGGLVIHAHPYREESYIPEVRLFPSLCHAVETINMGNINRSDAFNRRATHYAEEHGLPAVGGSDSHRVSDPHGGVRFYEKPKDLRDFIDTIKSGKGWDVIEEPLENRCF